MSKGEYDTPDLLADGMVHRLPARIAELAAEVAGCQIGVYVLDLDGSYALRLAGDERQFPDRIPARVGIGPEIIPEAFQLLEELVADRVGPTELWPLTVRDRIMGFLLARGRGHADLAPLAAQAGPALELATGYTDVIDAARRRLKIRPAAEIQQNLLPPRLARVAGADLAGAVLPGYDVGGDFFDYAANLDGLWLIVADATGKGNRAAAISALGTGALRAARRSGAGLQQAAEVADEAIASLGMDRFITAVIASWDADTYQLRWINCGHPNPLRIHADGRIEELSGPRTYPLGIDFGERRYPVCSAQLAPGDRLLLYSDGVTERRLGTNQRLGEDGLRSILTSGNPETAAMTVRRLQNAILDASPDPLHDDATLLMLAPYAALVNP